jgi:aspartate oxidase
MSQLEEQDTETLALREENIRLREALTKIKAFDPEWECIESLSNSDVQKLVLVMGYIAKTALSKEEGQGRKVMTENERKLTEKIAQLQYELDCKESEIEMMSVSLDDSSSLDFIPGLLTIFVLGLVFAIGFSFGAM